MITLDYFHFLNLKNERYLSHSAACRIEYELRMFKVAFFHAVNVKNVRYISLFYCVLKVELPE